MNTLTDDQIIANYNKLIKLINSLSNTDRRTKLLNLFSKFEDKIATAPASSSPKFHAAFPGGLITHTLNVCKFSMKIYDLWQSESANMDYDKESLLFCAIVHDLGKIGDELNDYYIVNESAWHVNNRQEYFKINNNLTWMRVQDRSLYWLQKYNIDITENEYITILTHDGLYDEGNKTYYMQFEAERKFKTNMPYVIHQADVMAMRIEFEKYK